MTDPVTGKDDQALDAVLHSWANETSSGDAFAAKLAAIPAQYPQPSQGLFRRVLTAAGGWGFAAPQLAGLVLAAWLGISTGSQMVADDEALVTEAMGEHIFGTQDLYEG